MQIQIFYIDMKNILLCISAFFSLSTACMQISILATAVVFVSEVSEHNVCKFSCANAILKLLKT